MFVYIFTDMNEVPLCELALSCDNLLCDAYGRPPSPLIVIYVKYSKGLCVKYGTTEIVEVSIKFVIKLSYIYKNNVYIFIIYL